MCMSVYTFIRKFFSRNWLSKWGIPSVKANIPCFPPALSSLWILLSSPSLPFFGPWPPRSFFPVHIPCGWWNIKEKQLNRKKGKYSHWPCNLDTFCVAVCSTFWTPIQLWKWYEKRSINVRLDSRKSSLENDCVFSQCWAKPQGEQMSLTNIFHSSCDLHLFLSLPCSKGRSKPAHLKKK